MGDAVVVGVYDLGTAKKKSHAYTVTVFDSFLAFQFVFVSKQQSCNTNVRYQICQKFSGHARLGVVSPILRAEAGSGPQRPSEILRAIYDCRQGRRVLLRGALALASAEG